VYVKLGGLVGSSIGRFLAPSVVHGIFPNIYFLIGTAAVNIIGGGLLNSSPSCGIAQPAQSGDEDGFTEWFACRGYEILDVWL